MTSTNHPSATPREVFLHLLGFGSLFVSVIALIQLLFQYVNKWFPDPLNPGYSLASQVRWSVAVLVVFVPVMLWVARTVERDFAVERERAKVAIRRWLLHFTMFLAGVTVLIDIATLAYNFLGGELSTRFFLKVLAVLAVAGLVLWYMREDARREGRALPVAAQRALWFGVGATVLLMVGGVWLVGSPKVERLARLDDQREQDVSTIQGQVIEYWRMKGALPASIDAISQPTGTWGVVPRDPETGKAYEYNILSEKDLSFSVCAVFAAEGKEENTQYPYQTYPYNYPTAMMNGAHSAGRSCFNTTIDRDMYPPYEKTSPR